MTLVPVTKQGNPYDKIHISVMNYGKFDDIIKKQSADMFMIGKEGYLEKLKNNKAYDVYAMQEQEGMFLVFQDSGKLKDASLRRSLASLIQPAQAVSSLKSNEDVYKRQMMNISYWQTRPQTVYPAPIFWR